MRNRTSAQIPRPCERFCPECEKWKHFSRFRSRVQGTHGTVCTKFNRLCKVCEQKERNKRKNTDRARSIIERRAEARAARLGCSKDFLWIQMNWKSMVAPYRGLLGSESGTVAADASCPGCGHDFEHERDIQIEHREPPRFKNDWARESARNLGFLCTNCNATKNDKDNSPWLDEQEDARLSNAHNRTPPLVGESDDGDESFWLPGFEPANKKCSSEGIES